MPKKALSRLIPFLIFLLVPSTQYLYAIPPIEGRVISVADGDTLTVLDVAKVRHKIRLAEIDAPESKQPFGQRAKQELLRICSDKQAVVQVSDIDRYGRSVGYVHCEGAHANLMLLSAGLAWFYVNYGVSPEFKKEEEKARGDKKGLWVEANAIAPWDWRRGQRANSVEESADVVKKSKSGICHDTSSKWYWKTKNYTPFASIAACLKSGGRLPRG